MIPRDTNGKAGFRWKVFSIGRTDRIQIDCTMFVKRSTTSNSGVTTTTTPTVILPSEGSENNTDDTFDEATGDSAGLNLLKTVIGSKFPNFKNTK